MDIDIILTKFLRGEASPEEISYVREWMNESEDNKRLFNQYKNIWDVAKPSFDPEDVDVVAAYTTVCAQIERETIVSDLRNKRPFWFYWQKVAAILAVPMIAITAYLLLSTPKIEDKVIVYQKVFSPKGGYSFLYLPDSSKVWLNSGSSLKYPVSFDTQERRVELEGEAFFEVESDTLYPFIVQTSKMDVRATGTSFNVEAYSEGQNTIVALVEGNVDIEVGSQKIDLSPNEKIDFDHVALKYQKTQEDLYKWYSWKDGILAFRNDPLDYVFKRLEQVYNVDFVIKDNRINKYVYHATFEEESFDEILRLLALSAPIYYKKIKNKSVTSGGFEKQIIEVYRR